MKGDSIVYILQLAAGREFEQVPFLSHHELGFLTWTNYCAHEAEWEIPCRACEVNPVPGGSLSLLLARCTRDQRLRSASRTCRQTVSTGSGCAPAGSPRTRADRKNCTVPTAPAPCSHLRSESWFRPAPIQRQSWQRPRRRCAKSVSSPLFFSAGLPWLLFYLLSLFSTL